jgi:hypothetical protein
MTKCKSRHDEISQLAYFKWQEAGCPSGDGHEFWLAAEKEFESKKKVPVAVTDKAVTGHRCCVEVKEKIESRPQMPLPKIIRYSEQKRNIPAIPWIERVRLFWARLTENP